MAEFIYRAVTKNGIIVRNRIEDANKQSVILRLKASDLTPIEITKLKTSSRMKRKPKKNIRDIGDLNSMANSANLFKESKQKNLTFKELLTTNVGDQKVTSRDLVIFTQNFYLLKKANFNNIHALTTIINSTENPTLRGILEDILAGVEAGDYMYTTMEYYSAIFPYIYINMIKVGELSGSLTNSLQQAVKYLDDNNEINKKLKTILIPNVIQFVFLLVMCFVGTLVAVPTIQKVYDSVGSTDKLPAITLWFSDVVNNLIAIWYIPTLIIIGIVAGIIYYINTPRGKYNFHYFKYTMPIFGKLFYALDFSRFLKAMLLNLENGMRIQDAIEVSKNVINNYVMLSIIETAINNIVVGQSWIQPFEKAGLSSPMVTEMLKIGMQTDLTEMMKKLLEYMEMDINNIIDNIMRVLPQVVYSIVGIVLIFFVIVVLVPCIEVYMGNFLFSAAGL